MSNIAIYLASLLQGQAVCRTSHPMADQYSSIATI